MTANGNGDTHGMWANTVGRLAPPRRTPVGLDLGGRRVKAVQLEHTGAGLRVVAAAVAPRAGAGATGAILTPREAAGLTDLLWRGGFTGNRVVLAAPSASVLHSVLELPPRSSGAPVEQIARVELARAHKCAADAFEMGCWDLPVPHRAGKATHVMAVGLPHASADPLLDVFESAGLRVEALDVAACALARACAPLVTNPGGITAILDVGWDGAVLTLMHKGTVVYGRVMADAGLGELQGAIARRLDLDAEATEYLMVDAGGRAGRRPAARGGGYAAEADADAGGGTAVLSDVDLPDEARRILAAHADRIARELEVSISYATHLYPDAAVSGLLLVGGGACVPDLANRLSAATGLPAAPASPCDVAACDPGLLGLCGSPVLTAALGLALFPRG